MSDHPGRDVRFRESGNGFGVLRGPAGTAQMDTTTDIPAPRQSPKRLPESQRSTYQFPVYRWINWLVVAGYGVGLVLMFFVGGIVGLPAAIIWPFFVAVFCAGVALLGRPRTLLNCMMFYFLLMPGNRLFGLIPIPLPGFVDELFFLPIVAVIVMNLVQPVRAAQVKGGLWFAPLFLLVAAISWYVNGKPSPFITARATLIMLKPFLLWYYCRLTSPFEDEKEIRFWIRFLLLYAAVQFFYNCIWQGGPWPRIHPDYSGGMFGMQSAHLIGYLSIYAIFGYVAWRFTSGAHESRWTRLVYGLAMVIVVYDLIFMTDTKHGLVMIPFAAVPFLIHPKIPLRMRQTMWVFMGILLLLSAFYIQMFFHGGLNRIVSSVRKQMLVNSPKADVYKAVTLDFHKLVPYPLFGAGPGRCGSQLSVDNQTPLARRYILPIMNERRRYFMTAGKANYGGGTQLRWPQSDLLTLLGEYGWLGAGLYAVFFGWVIVQLYRKSFRVGTHNLYFGATLASAATLIFLGMLMVIITPLTWPITSYVLWAFAGRLWEYQPDPETLSAPGGDSLPAPDEGPRTDA